MDGLNEILQRLEPSLGPLAGEPSELGGGITNRNFRVTLGDRDFVVRRPGKDTDLLGIDREAERLATATAARLGIAPEVAASLEECLVTRYIACRTADAGELQQRVEEIARALRSFHDAALEMPVSFWVPDLLESYALIVRRRGGELPAAYAQVLAIARRIGEALPLTRRRPCHNDLLPGNIIFAQQDERILIVDWEYAGMGDPRFDLGNLSVNNGFDEATDERLLAAYHGSPPTDGVRASLKLMRVMSDAREAAWGVVQGEVSELDFDFEGYGREHLRRLQDAVEQPRFEDWLSAAAHDMGDHGAEGA
ncbi:MAG TPA: choline/ethanolamine kinase family protein [Solirubrobacteraceae bacterium]|nr:choline/ethanolamine kinase family protein [Solirubrobacteraceae bacterium]